MEERVNDIVSVNRVMKLSNEMIINASVTYKFGTSLYPGK